MNSESSAIECGLGDLKNIGFTIASAVVVNNMYFDKIANRDNKTIGLVFTAGKEKKDDIYWSLCVFFENGIRCKSYLEDILKEKRAKYRDKPEQIEGHKKGTKKIQEEKTPEQRERDKERQRERDIRRNKERQREQQRDYRANRTPEQRERDKERQRDYRANRTPEQRERDKERRRDYRANRTPEQRERDKERQRERDIRRNKERQKEQQRDYRANRTPEQREAHKLYMKLYMRHYQRLKRAKLKTNAFEATF
jgi:hypothetical protein